MRRTLSQGDGVRAALVFAVIESADALARLGDALAVCDDDAMVWIVRRKGAKAAVRESEIMATLPARGYRPSKTAAWSATHSADRYSRAKAKP